MKINKIIEVIMFVMLAVVMGSAGVLSAQESTSGGLAPSGMTKEHHQPAYSKIRAECKSQAESQSLAGDDMHKFMKQCQSKAAATLGSGAMTKEHHQPAYSKIRAECKSQAESQSLTGDDMKKFMGECKAKAAATLPSGAMDKPKE